MSERSHDLTPQHQPILDEPAIDRRAELHGPAVPSSSRLRQAIQQLRGADLESYLTTLPHWQRPLARVLLSYELGAGGTALAQRLLTPTAPTATTETATATGVETAPSPVEPEVQAVAVQAYLLSARVLRELRAMQIDAAALQGMLASGDPLVVKTALAQLQHETAPGGRAALDFLDSLLGGVPRKLAQRAPVRLERPSEALRDELARVGDRQVIFDVPLSPAQATTRLLTDHPTARLDAGELSLPRLDAAPLEQAETLAQLGALVHQQQGVRQVLVERRGDDVAIVGRINPGDDVGSAPAATATWTAFQTACEARDRAAVERAVGRLTAADKTRALEDGVRDTLVAMLEPLTVARGVLHLKTTLRFPFGPGLDRILTAVAHVPALLPEVKEWFTQNRQDLVAGLTVMKDLTHDVTREAVNSVLNAARGVTDDQQATIATTDELVTWLRTIFPDGYPTTVLRRLERQVDRLLPAMQGNAPMRDWLCSNPAELTHIIRDAADKNAWISALLQNAKTEVMRDAIITDTAIWAPILIAFGNTGAQADKDVLKANAPLLTRCVFALNNGGAADFVEAVGAGLIEGITALRTLNDPVVELAFVAKPRFDNAAQKAAVRDARFPPLIPAFGPNTYPTEVFLKLADDPTTLPDLYKTTAALTRWLSSDETKFKKVLKDAAADLKHWIDPLISKSKGAFMLKQAAVDGPQWLNAVKDSGKYTQFMQQPPRDELLPDGSPEFTGFWNVYLAAKDIPERVAAFRRLYTVDIGATAGTHTSTGFWHGNAPDIYKYEIKFKSVVPSTDHFDVLMMQYKVMPRAHINTMTTMVFGDGNRDVRAKRTAPRESKDWGKWETQSLIKTSFYNPSTNTVVMNTRVRSGSLAAPLVYNASTAPDGTVDGAGFVGARGNEANNANYLSVWQNHATHEAGHAVGARTLKTQGMTGDAMATQWGNWKENLAGSTFFSKMWDSSAAPTAGGPGLGPTLSNVKALGFLKSIIAQSIVLPPPPSDAGAVWDQPTAWAATLARWGHQHLTKYVNSVTNSLASPKGDPYEFPGYTPLSPTVYIARDGGAKAASYDRAAFNNKKGLSWYAFSAPGETFAEMYTIKYGTRGTLPAPNNGITPTTFFTALDAATEADFGPAPASMRTGDVGPMEGGGWLG